MSFLQRERATVVGDGAGRLRVVVAGSNPQLSQDALLVESALRKHSATVTHLTLGGTERASEPVS